MSRRIFITLLLVMVVSGITALAFVALSGTTGGVSFPEKQLSEYTNPELEIMIEELYQMDRTWTRGRATIYQNELILRKLKEAKGE